jgi:tetratricopeptide (TPR) repeat protein
MPESTAVSAVVAGFAVVAAAAFMALAAQAGDDPPLYQNLGDYSRPITTESALAQDYFDQGLRLAYGFARSEAARSFQAAQAHDPNCAMCAWGKAWALGPYQNNPDGVGDQEDAYAAAQQALDLTHSAQPWERAVIEAMAVRYPAPGQETDAERGTQLYADAMRAAVAAHRDDLDVRTLYAESLMMFRPWNLYRDDGEPYAETRSAITELETVLGLDLHHAGACHLYIHAVEAYEPARAEACADQLAEVIPGVSHIQHMPSHIYMNIGRYGDAVRANQEALRMDQAADFGEAVSVYPSHNTMMLMYAAWMDGQSGVALSAARDLARERPEDTFQPYLQLARFGRWDELLQHAAPPEEPFQAGMWHFARGLAKLRTDDGAGAREAVEIIRTIRDDTPEDATYHFFLHSQQGLLGMAQHILAGEIAATQGDIQAAEEHLRRAVALEDGLGYSEPEPWPIPARHVLGAVLLEADKSREAAKVYRTALDVHPDDGWSLKGLEQSLAAQGKDAEAAEVRETFAQAWERADVWLPGSRF